ncbi:phosphatidylinositol mannoside acyltransferase [Corynebacterium terpenotabidum]|uniref:Lipid A biosynthesis lauroyl acyltransferase n=1 Tax=Corynebacterium terpenotabidum Y-11 TaxID=1200352 RepID=S4XCM3_9CORY|nr:phosphatidylinositol mannoside acyltransferase [Corynebacterium terpenotabidum]AGP30882.1 lipid A biosynthesis lauroyl acyltransferase [Corynebacterium terpenotabidum Y-11]
MAPTSPSTSLSEQLSALAYRAGWAVVQKLPEPVATRLFDLIADAASGRGKGPEQLRANLGRVVGDANVTRSLVRDAMRSYMRYWREAFQLPSIAGPELARRLDACFDPISVQRLADVYARGKGVVLTLPHSGNWDMAGMWLVHTHGQFTTVAERLKPESLFDAFVAFRESLGFEVLPLSGGEQPPFDRLREVLRDGGIVCLMGERDLSGKGIDVDFFGERTSMPAGSCRLAQDTGAPVMTAHCWFTDDGWGLTIDEEIDATLSLEEMVQVQADNFARNIAAHPADWHLLQPLWFADLSEKKRRRLGLED